MAVALSVVLPVLDEARFLPGTLEALFAQTLPPSDYEILVVDGGSSDGTREAVRALLPAHSNLRLVENPKRRSSAGRNAGWRAAQGACVLFLDGHVWIPSRALLEDTLTAFRAGHRVLARPQPLDPPGLSPFQRSVAAVRASWLGHQGASEIFREAEGEVDPSSSGAAYDRALLEELGGYDERFDAGEDVEFNERAKRAGHRAWTSPKFTVRYFPRETVRGLWRQCSRYGRGRARLWRKHPATLGRTVPLPPAYFCAGLAALLAAAIFPAARTMAALYWLPYALAVALASLGVLARTRGVAPAWIPVIFVVIHSGFSWGFLAELLRPGARFDPERR